MAFFVFISGYVREFFFSFMALLGLDKSGGNYMQAVYIVMTSLYLLIFLYQMFFKLNISKKEIVLLCSFLLLLLSFLFLPRVFFRSVSSAYQPVLLTAFSSVLSAFLMGIVAKRGDMIGKMSQITPVFVIINTITAASVVFGSSGTTSGGYLSDKSGFGYQGLSYFIAYTFAFNVFYIKNQHRIKGKSLFKRPGWNTFFQCLIPVHIFLALLAGGRGAFVLICILMFYYFAMDKQNFRKNFKNFLLIWGFVGVAFVLANVANLEYAGTDRILSLIAGVGDSNRDTLRKSAIDAFLSKPILGNGTGSIFPILKAYSHNIFTDILVEYGIVGLVIVIAIMSRFIKNLILLVKDSPENHLIVLMALCSFTMLLFSGYYLNNAQCWFVVAYVFSTTAPKREPIKKHVSKYIKTNQK